MYNRLHDCIVWLGISLRLTECFIAPSQIVVEKILTYVRCVLMSNSTKCVLKSHFWSQRTCGIRKKPDRKSPTQIFSWYFSTKVMQFAALTLFCTRKRFSDFWRLRNQAFYDRSSHKFVLNLMWCGNWSPFKNDSPISL